MTCSSSSGLTYYNQNGYSGTGAGRNNPSSQGQANIGPIPQGSYSVGSTYNSSRTGPNTMILTPNASTSQNITGSGRDPNSFRIHGNNASNDASHGCVILPPNRTTIPFGEIINVGP